MSNPENQTCETCRYSIITQPAEVSDDPDKSAPAKHACRRYPPQTHFLVVLRGNPLAGQQPRPVEEQRSSFPPVLPMWGCGEYAPAISITS